MSESNFITRFLGVDAPDSMSTDHHRLLVHWGRGCLVHGLLRRHIRRLRLVHLDQEREQREHNRQQNEHRKERSAFAGRRLTGA
jgi:hypothetical protein